MTSEGCHSITCSVTIAMAHYKVFECVLNMVVGGRVNREKATSGESSLGPKKQDLPRIMMSKGASRSRINIVDVKEDECRSKGVKKKICLCVQHWNHNPLIQLGFSLPADIHLNYVSCM